jgi:hypothetical protein
MLCLNHALTNHLSAGNINLTKFPICTRRIALSYDDLCENLRQWRRQLPSELQVWDEDEEGSFWVRMLDLIYKYSSHVPRQIRLALTVRKASI